MTIKNQILRCIEQQSPYDYERYLSILYDSNMGKYTRKVKAWKYIIKKAVIYVLNTRSKKHNGTESKELQRKDYKEYVEMLMRYDVISFDVFDTLIIRRILSSSDVYHFVGIKLQIVGFREIRQFAEIEARRRAKLSELEDIELRDIYSVLNEWIGVNIDEGVATEVEVEKALCIANPYWKAVFVELIKRGKRVILTTDMYITEKDIRTILQNSGYFGIEKIYVSCDLGVSKRSGKLFEFIQNDLGNDKRYVHIGDNLQSDYTAAKKNGWDAVYYKGIHNVGRKYRNMNKSILIESVTGGIIDAKLHNGIVDLDSLEEFGFNYYGRLHVGYCQWLDNLAREKNIDKFLFVSRDGYLMQKIYNDFCGRIPNEYVYVSRYALSQINVFEDMDMFIQQNIEPRVPHRKQTIHQIFVELGLQELEYDLAQYDIVTSEILNGANYKKLKRFLYSEKQKVACIYESARIAAEKYFSQIIEGCNTICVVDIGWVGTCTRGITTFLNKHMKWKGKVYGAQIGIESGKQNIGMYEQRNLCAYVFSPSYNSKIYRERDFGIGNVVDEIVFSAPEPALYQYRLDKDGNVQFEFLSEPEQNLEIVKKIQKGVYEYAKEYFELEQKMGIKLIIDAETAYLPVLNICKKRSYINKLLGDYSVQRLAATKYSESVKTSDV